MSRKAMHHEFNNLLSVITLNAELLLDSLGEEDAFLRHGLALILSSSARASELTRQLRAKNKGLQA
jgi:hypothetical protein